MTTASYSSLKNRLTNELVRARLSRFFRRSHPAVGWSGCTGSLQYSGMIIWMYESERDTRQRQRVNFSGCMCLPMQGSPASGLRPKYMGLYLVLLHSTWCVIPGEGESINVWLGGRCTPCDNIVIRDAGRASICAVGDIFAQGYFLAFLAFSGSTSEFAWHATRNTTVHLNKQIKRPVPETLEEIKPVKNNR